ncbi:MAG TPA: hypothetical protein VLQ48_09440 [Chloroflexia bacterium]|nr:hypothetical protein [Chloroflexia bacterium]
MDRAIIGILRVLGWLILIVGSLLGIFLIIASHPLNGGANPTFETDVIDTSGPSQVIFGLLTIFGSLLAWALISTIAIAAEAILDMRDVQSPADAEYR